MTGNFSKIGRLFAFSLLILLLIWLASEKLAVTTPVYVPTLILIAASGLLLTLIVYLVFSRLLNQTKK